MKNIKKLIVMLLTLAMVFTMNIAAFADETTTDHSNDYTITINANDKASDSYEAYQIFKGDLSGSVLSNIEWGSGIDSTKVAALQTELGVTSAADAAAKLAATDSTKIAAATFADTVAKYLSTTKITNTGSAIYVPKTAAGYYLIKNADGSAEQGEAYTKFVLEVVKDCDFTPKTDAPEVEKKLKNADEAVTAYRDANNVAIGDTINYKLSSTVPDMSKYDQYYFIMNDTMSKGLSYQGNMVVKVGDTTLTETTSDDDKGATYKLTKTENADGTTTLEIVFSNFKQYTKDQAVTVTYDAKLDTDAVVGTNGNPNNVELVYSNNPNKKGTGVNKPGEEDEDVTGTTPKDWVITYTTNLAIFKYDGATKTALSDVQFTLTGVKNNDVTTVTEVYVESETGTYYQLNDGSYTTTAPNGKNDKCYQSTTTKYALDTTKSTVSSTDTVSETVTTDENGYAKFSNTLAAGTYKIVEIVGKDGYNMLTTPITVTISCDSNTMTDVKGTETCTWTVTGADNAIIDGAVNAPETATIDVTNIVNIENNQGTTLPTTGGIGTTIFYALGSMLVIFAGVVLVARRRIAR